MATEPSTFQTRSKEILAVLGTGDSSSAEIQRVVQDLRAVETKLQALHSYYTTAYERLGQLEKRLQDLR